MKLSEAITEWEIYERLYRSQVDSYVGNMRRFCRALGDKDIKAVTELDVYAFVNAKGKQKMGTKQSYLSSLKSLFKLMTSRGHIAIDPAAPVRVSRRVLTFQQQEPKVRVPVTHEEYLNLQTNLDEPYAFMVGIAYWTGLRLSDVMRLEEGQWVGNELIVWTTKRGKRVALPLDDPLLGDSYLLNYKSVWTGSKDGYIFPDIKHYALAYNNSTFKMRLRTAFNKCGVKDKSFHCLRHAFVTRLATHGKTFEEIGRLVAHSKEETTKGYCHGE